MESSHQAHWDQLRDFVARLMERHRVPGVAVGVLHRGEVAAAGFGVTNVDHPLPVTAETLFQIGSITKTFTGTLVMRLVEMGKLELDATVRTYVPDFRVQDQAASEQATIRDLLIHMGGWHGDFFLETGAGDDASAKYVAAMADLEQLAPIGTVWSYNNAGFYLAGRVIETVTEKSFPDALQEFVLEPLGLKHSYLNPTDVMTHRFVVGHNVGEEGAQVARPWPLPRAAWAAGGLICNVHDLLRYARFHLGDGTTEDGTRLLKLESLSQMQAPQTTVWGKDSWGLTWAVTELDGVVQLSHGGGTTGQISLLILIPKYDFAIAIFTNADRGGIITRDLSRWALKQYCALEAPEPKPIEAPLDQLASYVGRYSNPMVDIEAGILNGKLVAQLIYKAGFPSQDVPPPPPPPPMSLALCEEDRLLVMDGPFKDGRVDVVRKADGSIGWLRSGGRIHKREDVSPDH